MEEVGEGNRERREGEGEKGRGERLQKDEAGRGGREGEGVVGSRPQVWSSWSGGCYRSWVPRWGWGGMREGEGRGRCVCCGSSV